MENPDEKAECCHVCWDGESYEDNPILFCETCDVAVHKGCYGIVRIPTGDWNCKACVFKKKNPSKRAPQCCLCPTPGGALKPTGNGKWCHLFCSQWMPETFIDDIKTMEPVMGIGDIDKERNALTCSVCKKRGCGPCIQCVFGHCAVAYHPICAFNAGDHTMQIKTRIGEEGCQYLSYCVKHSKVIGASASGKKREEDSVEEDGDDGETSERETEITDSDVDISESVSMSKKRGRGRPTKAELEARKRASVGTPVATGRSTRGKPSPPLEFSRTFTKVTERDQALEDAEHDEEGAEKENANAAGIASIDAMERAKEREREREKQLHEVADAEIKSLLMNDVTLSKRTIAEVAKSAGVVGGTRVLEAWIASDAKESATEHQPVVQAIRAWLRKESLQAMSPKKPIADGGEDGQSNGAVLMDVEEGAGAVGLGRSALMGVTKEGEEGVKAEDDPAMALVGHPDGPEHDPPVDIQHLSEHTIQVLAMPPPGMPEEPESARQDDDTSKTEKKPGPGRPPKCPVCVVHKKGICGTVSAPLKCHCRNKQAAAQVTPDSPSATWEEGEEPDSMEEELAKLDRATDLLGLAPDDEVVGELLQAQAALARTLWITRTLAAKALTNAKAAAADEAADRQEKIEWVEETEKYEERWRGGRWREEYLRKRGLPSADLQGAFGAMSGTISPGGTTQLSPGGTRHQLAELVDPLVETGAMEDALCAVCGGGDSEEPNEIIFCERCEVAVHQDCYGVDEVPEDDWLCWPCHVAEENEKARGMPPSRPPRWLREAGDGSLYDPRPACVLCPVKRGALRAVIEPAPPPKHSAPRSAAAIVSAAAAPATPSKDGGYGDSTLVDGPAAAGGDAEPTRQTAVNIEARTESGAADEENCNKILPNSPAAVRRAALVGYDVHPGKDPHTVCPPVGAPVKKESDEGAVRWAHVVCAQCVPGIDFASAPEPGVASAVVRGLDRVPRSAFEADCIVCRRSEGAVVQCTAPGCTLNFHPLCARRNGWLLSEAEFQNSKRHAFCGRHSMAERRRLEAGGDPRAVGGGGRGRGRPPLSGRGGRGGRGPKAGGSKRRPPPTRDEMELLKRSRYGLEKLRILCERVLRREKLKRSELELQTELWSMQMAGLDDGGGATTEISPPPSPSRLRAWMTPRMADSLNATLPLGYAYQPESP